jgi:uncharacterized membrane protein YoaK (UPF0700 family)
MPRSRRLTMRPARGLARCFAIMLGFLVGTAVGTLAYVATGAWGLLLPVAIMYAIFAWARARPLAQD